MPSFDESERRRRQRLRARSATKSATSQRSGCFVDGRERPQRGENALDTRVGPTAGRQYECDYRLLPSSVLVVDDDPTFFAIATRILACLGIEVAGTATSAAQALEVVHDARPSAVLVDVGLPDRNGIDLAYEFADLPWAPRVVLISADREASTAIRERPGRARPLFVAKEDLDVETLRRALLN